MNEKIRQLVTIMVFAVLMICCSSLWAAQTVTLVDGTILRGEVVEMNNNTYRVRTSSVGDVLIPADQVATIVRDSAASAGNWQPQTHQGRNAPAQSAPRAGNPSHEQEQENINARVQSMMMNEDFLGKVMSLSQSEDWMEVMSDPEIMALIESLDYEALMNNDKMQRLMNSQETKSLFEDLGY